MSTPEIVARNNAEVESRSTTATLHATILWMDIPLKNLLNLCSNYTFVSSVIKRQKQNENVALMIARNVTPWAWPLNLSLPR